MPITVLGGTKLADTGYEIANSVRFNDGDSPSLRRTIPDDASSTGSRVLWTFSTWLKRGVLGTQQAIFGSYQNSNYHTVIEFNTSDQLNFFDEYNGSKNGQRTTSRVFRDCSAWYHIVCIWDKDNGTDDNKMRVYVNGVEESAFGTNSVPSNGCTLGADDQDMSIGERETVGQNFDGYFAETFFVDGTAYAASVFGEFDEDSPTIWKPKDCSDDLTFGTNGFWLDYEASGNLGNDANGGTDYTEANLAAADQSTDSPTNNFATMNPLDNYYPASTFSEGNCKVVQGGSAYAWNLSTIAVTAGKWYAEAKLTTSGAYALVGITDQSPVRKLTDVLGSDAYDYSIYQYNGDLFNNAGTDPSNDDANYAASYASGDIIGIALDLDNNKIYFSKGGAWSDGAGSWGSTTFADDTGDVSITAAASTGNGNYFFASGDYQSASQPTWEWNFGGCPPNTISSGNADGNGYGNFEYSVPSGFYSLCTKNLGAYGG